MKLLKYGPAMVLCLILCVMLVPINARADGIAINETNFPDANFRDYVSGSLIDKDQNGVLSSTELAAVTELYLYERELTSLKGVEYFTEITSLICSKNALTSLDVTKNTALRTLSCYDNNLTALNVTKNTALRTLSCYNNNLTALNVTKNTELTSLYCYNNSLEALNLTKNTVLTSLDCSSNKLTDLDVTQNTALEYLFCSNNLLTSLDVTKNTALMDLGCGDNRLTALNLTKNTALQSLSCGKNELTSLNLTKNPDLRGLYCNRTKITSLNVSALTKLESLSMEGTPISSLDISKMTKLEYLNLCGTALKEFTIPFFIETVRFYGNPGCRLILQSTGPYMNDRTDVSICTEYLNGEVYCEYHMVTGGGGHWYLGVDSPISLKGNTEPTITKQPKDACANSGTVTFRAEATGEGLHYQWYSYHYYSGGASGWYWREMDEETGPELTIDATEDNDEDLYFCRVSNSSGRACTKVVTFSYYKTPRIKSQPRRFGVAAGTQLTLSVSASGGNLSYQWYYKKPGDTEWNLVQASSGKTADYTFTVEKRHNGYRYKCVVSNGIGSAETGIASLEVFTVPVFTTQPKDTAVAEGKTATFKVSAAGGDLSYQWYYMKPGTGEWKPVANNGTDPTYQLKTEDRHNGYKYRCKVSNSYGEEMSSIAELTVVTAKPTITTQPKSVKVAAGKTATFKVVADGRGIDYLWLYCKPGETGWNEVSAASGKTASYSLTAADKHNGYQYRCRVRNAKGTVYTNIVTLTVGSNPTITTQPKDQTVNEGKTATFKVAASGATGYQWQYLKPAESTWKDVKNNGTSATYQLTTEARHNGYQYRCKVSNASGSVLSNPVTLTVNPKPVITSQPQSVTVQAGEIAAFTLQADGTPLSYQWWYLKPGTSEWKVVLQRGTEATYKLTAEPRHNGYKYKCVVKNTAGEVTSKIVTLTVN